MIPKILFGTSLSIANVGRRNHSGKISKGVANGSASSPIDVGTSMANASDMLSRPKIQIGNMYNKSFGQATS